jgi:hypothetical protein
MSYTNQDAAADGMAYEMRAARRKLEAEYGQVICCECDRPAHPLSCYCDVCEPEPDSQD